VAFRREEGNANSKKKDVASGDCFKILQYHYLSINSTKIQQKYFDFGKKNFIFPTQNTRKTFWTWKHPKVPPRKRKSEIMKTGIWKNVFLSSTRNHRARFETELNKKIADIFALQDRIYQLRYDFSNSRTKEIINLEITVSLFSLCWIPSPILLILEFGKGFASTND
jgi:hypothetical protein